MAAMPNEPFRLYWLDDGNTVQGPWPSLTLLCDAVIGSPDEPITKFRVFTTDPRRAIYHSVTDLDENEVWLGAGIVNDEMKRLLESH